MDEKKVPVPARKPKKKMNTGDAWLNQGPYLKFLRLQNLCSRSTALSHSYEIYFRIASHKIRKLKTYLAFQGARRAREKDPIKIAKNTLTTAPALAVNRVN